MVRHKQWQPISQIKANKQTKIFTVLKELLCRETSSQVWIYPCERWQSLGERIMLCWQRLYVFTLDADRMLPDMEDKYKNDLLGSN